MTTKFQFRRGTAAAWTSANPTLAAGEPGFETDTGKVKVGDGTTAWNSLAYLSGGGSPSGSAGGALDGTYPNPGIASSVAGDGLSESSDVLSVNADGSTLEIATDALQVKDGGITSAKIANGTIVDADVSGSAAIAYSKLALGTSLASGDLSAALAASLRPWTVVSKTLDETVAGSTALQDDDELSFSTSAGTTYHIMFLLLYVSASGGSTPDMKTAYGEDNTARGSFQQFGLGVSDSTAANQALSNLTATMLWGTAATNRLALIIGVHYGAGGTFKLQWAQNTSSGAPNGTTIKAGSKLLYTTVP